jgi:hypothetical protein
MFKHLLAIFILGSLMLLLLSLGSPQPLTTVASAQDLAPYQHIDPSSGPVYPCPTNPVEATTQVIPSWAAKIAKGRLAEVSIPLPIEDISLSNELQGRTQLLRNNGFDSGQLDPWATLGNVHLDSAVSISKPYSVCLGGYNNAIDLMAQEVTLPAETIEMTLKFWIISSTNESEALPSNDYFCWGIRDASSSYYADRICFDIVEELVPRSQWILFTFEINPDKLTRLLGRPVLMVFLFQTNEAESSSVWLDNVALIATVDDDLNPNPNPRQYYIYLPLLSR